MHRATATPPAPSGGTIDATSRVTIRSASRSAAADGLAINAMNATATRNRIGLFGARVSRIGRLTPDFLRIVESSPVEALTADLCQHFGHRWYRSVYPRRPPPAPGAT